MATQRQLSERERQFVEAFMGSGNATKAAVLGGYSRNTASQIGYRLLRKVQIQQAIAARAKADPKVADRVERQRFYSTVMRDRQAKTCDRLAAAEVLGKTQGDFIKRVQFENVPPFHLILDDRRS